MVAEHQPVDDTSTGLQVVRTEDASITPAAAAVKEFITEHLENISGPEVTSRGTVTWTADCPLCDGTSRAAIAVKPSGTVTAKCANVACRLTWNRLRKTVAGGDDRPEIPADESGRNRPSIEVTNTAIASDWLTSELGRNGLAGVFRRGDQLISTPLIGEDGYQAPKPKYDAVGQQTNRADSNGPATVRTVDAAWINSTISGRYNCQRYHDKSGWSYSLFPNAATANAIGNIDLCPNLSEVRGITHTPTMRPNGSVLGRPGYDQATGLLYLPNDNYPPVPHTPSPTEITMARDLLLEMIAGFDFVTNHDRANFLALLLMPVLRTMVDRDRKMVAITAHQPGSGKTLLESLPRTLFGGVVRSEFPDNETELGKALFSLLMTTTAPILTFDNVDKTGAVKSGVLAGFLTASEITDRILGQSETGTATNDRIVVVTGNNIVIGGDNARRTLMVRIDPGVPDPENRTDFAIENLGEWVTERRGQLVAALLTLARAWVVAGRPVEQETSDSFAPMLQVINGILTVADIEGRANHEEVAPVNEGDGEEEWSNMLAAIYARWGRNQWTAKVLLEEVSNVGGLEEDILPTWLTDQTKYGNKPITALGRSLGKGLTHREGRWVDGYTVRQVGEAQRAKLWSVEKYGDQ